VPTHAAFLRGVNLGNTRKITGAQLREHFEAMGFDDVAPFRTSGNVVFGAGRQPAAKLKPRIEKGLAGAAGFEVVVFVRTAAQMRTLAAAKPFQAPDGKLHVSFLERKPPAKVRKQVLAMATARDRLAFGDAELFWLTSGRMMESELDLEALDKLIGPSTRRTMGTIEALTRKFY
jgi:uncharacterized protein (DUF1697 family)